MTTKFRLLAAGALLAAGLPIAALAQGTTTAPVNVNVTASVSAVCNLSTPTTDIAFGAIDAFTATAVNAAGSVSLTCNRGAVVTMEVDNGLHNSSGRRMASGGDFIPYQIFQPNINGTNTDCTGVITPWGTAAAAFTATGLFASSGGPRNILLCGQVAAAPASGYATGATYTDTVAVTATYQ